MLMNKRVVYIAGKMAGLPDKGRVAFMEAQARLQQLGCVVLNPAVLPDGMPGNRYMPICLAMISQADALVLLDGWEDSPGANLEKEYAEYQKIQVYHMRSEEAIASLNRRASDDLT